MTKQGKIWQFRSDFADRAPAFADELSISPLLARLLLQRGINEADKARQFLSPSLDQLNSPFLFPDMEAAVARVAAAISAGEKVCVFGDYDVDGVTSTALLVEVLTKIGADVTFYIPHRIDEGYGLSFDAMHTLSGRGIKLIVSVDCGVTAVAEIAAAAQLGIDVIVTDHHRAGDVNPEAAAIIHPLFGYPFPDLAGVGVAYKLGEALLQRLLPGASPDQAADAAHSLLDMVCMGTIADSVPLRDENRVLVVAGLKVLSATPRLGLQALMKVAGLDPRAKPLVVRDINFGLAPRLNAAGRLKTAERCVELLLTKDRAEAEAIAAELDLCNRERQGIEEKIRKRAIELAESTVDLERDKVIVLADEGWHTGVQGIVCSKLLELYGKPTCLLTIEGGVAKGSARSHGSYSLHAALRNCEELLSRYGGHAYAAGMALPVENLEAFRAAMNAYADQVMTEADLRGSLLLDAEIEPAQVTPELIAELEALEPHGMGNPAPVFSICGYLDDIRRVGQKKTHLKFLLSGHAAILEAIAFHQLAEPEFFGKYQLAAHLEKDSWMGEERLQLKVTELRPFDCEVLKEAGGDAAVSNGQTALAPAAEEALPSAEVEAAISLQLSGGSAHLYTYDREDLVRFTAGLHEKGAGVAWVFPDEASSRLYQEWAARFHPFLASAGIFLSRRTPLARQREAISGLVHQSRGSGRFVVMPALILEENPSLLRELGERWIPIFVDPSGKALEIAKEHGSTGMNAAFVSLGGWTERNALRSDLPGEPIVRSAPRSFRLIDKRETDPAPYIASLLAREHKSAVFGGVEVLGTDVTDGGPSGANAAAHANADRHKAPGDKPDDDVAADDTPAAGITAAGITSAGTPAAPASPADPFDADGLCNIAVADIPASEWELRQLGLSLWGRPAILHLVYGTTGLARREAALERTAPTREVLAQIYRRMRELSMLKEADIAAALTEQFGSDAATTALRIFEEIGAIEVRPAAPATPASDPAASGSGHAPSGSSAPSGDIRIRNIQGKLSLESSSAYRSCIQERHAFERFRSTAIRGNLRQLDKILSGTGTP